MEHSTKIETLSASAWDFETNWKDQGVKEWWKEKSLLPFNAQSSIIVSGPTNSGKTSWVYRLLRNLSGMYQSEPPERILYCYGVWQQLYEDMEQNISNISFHEGLPSKEILDELSDENTKVLIILDDLFNKVVSSENVADVFTSGCHHKGFSCVFITQNIFNQGKFARTLALNSSYLVVFKNIRDASQIGILGRQLYPSKGKYFVESYEDATSVPHGYLVIDLTCRGNDRFPLRTKIFPGEDCFTYLPKL